jgi:hypothetical protein
MGHSATLRNSCALIALVIAGLLVSPGRSDAAAFEAFIPPKYKGVIVAAPIPRYPHAFWYIPGRVGWYRLKVNQQTGAVAEVNVMKRPEPGQGVPDANAAMILEFFKWRFKPGSIKQLDVPVEFDRDEPHPELKNATSH